MCAVIVVASAGFVRVLSGVRFFQQLNSKALDAHFVVRGRVPSSKIVLVMVDKETLGKFPEPLIFWHRYYAKIVSAAADAGAKVIGLDYQFVIPVDKWEPENDQIIAEAVATSRVPVICGYIPALIAKWPVRVNMTCAGLGLAADTNLTIDSDGFVRRQELIEAATRNPTDRPPIRFMALRMAEEYLGKRAVIENGRLSLGGQPIPIYEDRSITISFAGPPDTFERVSVADFLAAAGDGKKQQLRDWVEGKAVLIGLDMDVYPTPFYTAFSRGKWLTPRAEIHASTLLTLIERKFLVAAPEWSRITASLATASMTVLIATTLAAIPAGGWLLLELAVILIGTHLLFRAGFVLPTPELVSAAVICLIGSILYRGELYHKFLSLFVGQRFADETRRSPVPKLSGRLLNVTILFTDIRGFTAFSERVCNEQGPEELVRILNEYMDQMVSIVISYQGHVNKYIGDGILAIFSDDDQDAVSGDHAVRAVRCATEMVSAPSRFSTGAGIHTGRAVLGNVGSVRHKMEYTVLGDTVNSASRLESLNKDQHTKLLMSESTFIELKGGVETVYLGTGQVRGVAEPMKLYTVSSLRPAPLAVGHAQ
jgi:adenylate cyclase